MQVSFGMSLLERGLSRIGVEPSTNPKPVRLPLRNGYPVVDAYLRTRSRRGFYAKAEKWDGVRREGSQWVVSAVNQTLDPDGMKKTINQEFLISERIVVGSRRITGRAGVSGREDDTIVSEDSVE